jgi:hypothetical protein
MQRYLDYYHDVDTSAREIVQAARIDANASRLARQVITSLSESVRENFLEYAVWDLVRELQRWRVHDVEREATRCAEREARIVTEQERERERVERLAYWEKYPSIAPKNTRAYRAWAQTDVGQASLARERASAERREREDERARTEFGGSKFAMHLHDMKEHMRAEIRLELTAELLDAPFALGNGTTVTWGDASIEDHERRIEMLVAHAGGTLATAQRHDAAISMIRAGDVTCLRDLAQQRGAA